jgi:hypothetical protein
VFAWCEAPRSEEIRDAMAAAFQLHGLSADRWISPIESRGAQVIEA